MYSQINKCNKVSKIIGVYLVLEYQLKTVTIWFKPKKNQVNSLVTIWNSAMDFDEWFNRTVERLKSNKDYKKRTIIGYEYKVQKTLSIKL